MCWFTVVLSSSEMTWWLIPTWNSPDWNIVEALLSLQWSQSYSSVFFSVQDWIILEVSAMRAGSTGWSAFNELCLLNWALFPFSPRMAAAPAAPMSGWMLTLSANALWWHKGLDGRGFKGIIPLPSLPLSFFQADNSHICTDCSRELRAEATAWN